MSDEAGECSRVDWQRLVWPCAKIIGNLHEKSKNFDSYVHVLTANVGWGGWGGVVEATFFFFSLGEGGRD